MARSLIGKSATAELITDQLSATSVVRRWFVRIERVSRYLSEFVAISCRASVESQVAPVVHIDRARTRTHIHTHCFLLFVLRATESRSANGKSVKSARFYCSLLCAGNVKILHDGKWGSVCDDEWDDLEADVVCRQLGFNGAIKATTNGRFGQARSETILFVFSS